MLGKDFLPAIPGIRAWCRRGWGFLIEYLGAHDSPLSFPRSDKVQRCCTCPVSSSLADHA